MSLEVPQVFISSTSEFAAERAALATKIRTDQELGVIPYDHTAEAPPGTSPLEECARQLRQSELVILMIGAKFGTPLPEPNGLRGWLRRRFHGLQPPKSIVQWEYEYTKKLRRDLHPYVREFGNDTTIEELQKKFRGLITHFEKGTWSILYTKPDEFVERSHKNVRMWRMRFWEGFNKSKPARKNWMQQALLFTTGVVSCALVAVAILSMRGNVPSETLVIAAGSLVAALIILGILLVKSGEIA